MIASNTTAAIEILLVEDNPGDVRLTQEMLREARVANRLSVATDGEQALDYLHGRPPFDAVRRPDLVLLDLNLPKKNGQEVLAEIKQHPELRRIPVVVLTTSRAEEDILRSYDLHANCYVTKPVDLPQFMTVVQSIEDFWLTVVKLPRP
ncbi:MAG TPA: response regulator [Vicinamibacterales bacterium]|nr:response regulator [Vicinamibacterales bacterium]